MSSVCRFLDDSVSCHLFSVPFHGVSSLNPSQIIPDYRGQHKDNQLSLSIEPTSSERMNNKKNIVL